MGRVKRARFEQALAVAREIGDQQRTAIALSNLGNISLNEGDLDAAYALYREALGIYEQLDEHVNQAVALENLGLVELARGEREQAIATFERGPSRAPRPGQATHEAASVSIPLARARLAAGELDRPCELLISALADAAGARRSAQVGRVHGGVRERRRGGGSGPTTPLRCSAPPTRSGARSERSATATSAAGTRSTVERVRDALGEEAFAAGTARGRLLSVEEAVALCGELSGRPAATA